MQSIPPELKPGDVLDGRYVLRERIAEGGMGSVFAADQPALERRVAIKLLHPELAHRQVHAQRIRDEARAACHVRNPHCVTVIDFSVLPDGTSYMVMEHVPGKPLRQVIAEETITLPRALDLLDQILSALAATHDAGFVHADVKSENFLVERVNGSDHVTMIDFGLARAAGSQSAFDTENGEVMVSGTPEYMAPEVVRGEPAVPASDLYSAGVILYELLTGTTPFTGGTATEIMLSHLQDVVVPPSLRRPDRKIPPEIDRVVLRALAKRASRRFSDAAMFASELRAAAHIADSSRTVTARPDSSSLDSPTRDYTVAARVAFGSDCGGRIEPHHPATGPLHHTTLVNVAV